jgi:signal transduction histidine kinase
VLIPSAANKFRLAVTTDRGRSSQERIRIWWFAAILFCSNAFATFEMGEGLQAGARGGATSHQELGRPFIRNFEPTEYGGFPQNWSIAQDHQGVIYIANTQGGVLAFDGSHWRSITLPNLSGARALAADSDGRIYVGAVGEIGYLAPDSRGQMNYVSLLDLVAPEDRKFAIVGAVLATAEGVYFVSSSHLFRFRANTIRVWQPKTAFRGAFWVNNSLLVREADRGLSRLTDDELVLVAGGERFAKERISAVLPLGAPTGTRSESMLLATLTQGWWVHDGLQFHPWPTSADAALKRDGMSSAIELADGTLAVSTLQDGLTLLDGQGRVLRHLSKANGLGSDGIYTLFQDRQRGLWLGLESGVTRLDLGSPITQYDDSMGLKGAVIGLERHEGSLHAATSRGLFRMQADAQTGSQFVSVNVVPRGQIWALLRFESSLLVATGAGVYELDQGVARLIRASSMGSVSLLRSTSDPSRVYVGLQDGIASMRLEAGHWVDEGPVPGVSGDARSLFEEPDGRLWLGRWTGGAVRLRFPSARAGSDHSSPAVEVEHFGAEHGLPVGYVYVHSIDGAPRFTGKSGGVLQFDESRRRFLSDARFDALFPQGSREIWLLSQDPNGRIWMATADRVHGLREVGAAVKAADGRYRWQPTPLQPIAGSNIFAIRSDLDGVLWFGGVQGLFRYDPGSRNIDETAFTALIHQVTGKDGRLLYAGSGRASKPEIDHADNALRFEFSSPSFDTLKANRFQMLLEGLDQDWSDWSGENYRDYTNLAGGDYRFRVRARNVYGIESAEAAYEFRILRPWFRAAWGYLSYLLVVAALGWGYVRWRTRRLEVEKRGLQAVLDERARLARELHDNVSQTVTGILLQLDAAKSAQGDREDSAAARSAGLLHIERAAQLARQAMTQTRRTLRGLGPSELSVELSLADVLRNSLERLTEGTATKVRVSANGYQFALPSDIELELYRIGQEAASNALRHGRASEIEVTLTFEAHGIRLCLCDNGRGFDSEIPSEEDSGLGLAGMRARVQRMRGEIRIDSNPGRGSCVEVYVPLPNRQ